MLNKELTFEIFEICELEGITQKAEYFDKEDIANANGYYWFDEIDRWVHIELYNNTFK